MTADIEIKTVKLRKDIVDSIVPTVQKAMGYKVKINDFVEKAVLKELEELKNSKQSSLKRKTA